VQLQTPLCFCIAIVPLNSERVGLVEALWGCYTGPLGFFPAGECGVYCLCTGNLIVDAMKF
jgi:hypothetical protein